MNSLITNISTMTQNMNFKIMRNAIVRLFLFILCFLTPTFSFGQLTGIKTIPGDYATIALAVADLNVQGVGTGGVTFNVTAGHSEILSGKITMTATGTAANPIVFQKSGIGSNPVLIAYTGTVATPSVLADGFWVLAGSDYVTINGIDLQENVANSSTTTVMEFGYGLFKTSDFDGCQHNTITNCTITLNRLQNTAWTAPGHNGSIGIAVLNGLHTATGAVTVTTPDGSNSFNNFYSNTIQNCNAGIAIVGFAAASPYTLGDTNNDIGGSNPSTGNIIINFGGAISASNPATGIFASSQWDLNVSYNTINNNTGAGVNHTTTMRGIFMNSSSPGASADCNFNTITLTGNASSSDLTFIENGFGSTPSANTININNNTLTGSYVNATSGSLRGIYNNTATPQTLNILNNSISNLQYGNGGLAGSGTVYPIHASGSNANMSLNIYNNVISNVSRTGTTGGTTIGIYAASGVSGMAVTINNNTVQNMNITGSGTASTMYGIQASTGTIVIENNLVQSLSCVKSTGTGALYGIYDVSGPVNENYNNNTINNLSHAGTGTVAGLVANTAAGTRTVSGNTIHSITAAGTTAAGMILSLSSPNVFNNKVYNISSTNTGATTVSGISLNSVSANGTANIYNNIIGDLNAMDANIATASLPAIRGINITASNGSTTINVYHNTVRLNANSFGANFGTAALYTNTSLTATTSALTLQNNILINLSSPAGIGYTTAYMRNGTSLANYNTISNNNLFFAGTPGPQRLVFYDGTNAIQTINDMKCFVAPRESNSVTENPSFISLIGSNANFLHVSTTTPTQIESGGLAVVGITDDFDGDIRQGNIGYTGTGTAPDIGADENNFLTLDLSGPAISYTLVPNSICTDGISLTATITDASGVNTAAGTKPRLWFRKSTELNVLPATNTAADNGWKWVEATNSASPFTFDFNFNLLSSPAVFGDVIEYFVVAQDLVGIPNVGANTVVYNACSAPATVALGAGNFPVSATNTFTIITPPSPVPVSVSPVNLCLTGNSVITLGANLGAQYQWESSPAGANNWTPIVGATSLTYNATGLVDSTDFRCVITCNSTPVIGVSPSAIGTVNVADPEVLSTTPGFQCTLDSAQVLLTATTNVGSNLNWYTSPSSMVPIGTGDTLITPYITATTTYYVSASQGGSSMFVGPSNPSIGTISSSTIAIGTQRMFFDVIADATITTIDIYPTAPIGSTGSITIRNSSQVIIADVQYTTTVTGGNLQTIPMNVFLPTGNAYEIGQGTAIGLNRNTTGAVYPYTSAAINITGNTFDPNYYYFFYNWQVTVGCETPRVPVTATILNSGPSTSTDVQTACGTYTWIDGNTYTTSNSTATYTIFGGAASGCDSIITLNLTINNPTTGVDVQTACGSYTWIDNNTYTSSNNTATFTIVGGAANGCDSTVTLNLTINNPTTGTDVQTACGSYIWIDNNTYTSSNNTATFTIVGGAANGCDSTVTLNLTINNPSTGTDVQTACGSYTWIDNNTYTSSNNTATFTIVGGAANGCDSTVTLNLTVNTVDTAVTVNSATLTANAVGATYQWIDCNNGNAPIAGETNQSFTPSSNGSYAVVITENSCTDTSGCFLILNTGISATTMNDEHFNLYPNPTDGQITIDFEQEVNGAVIRVMGVDGRLLQEHNEINGNRINISLSDYPAAMYFVEVILNGQSKKVKVIKL